MTTGRHGFWIRQELLGPLLRRLSPVLYAAACVWRRLLFRTTFVAVTGSLGKTTTKECLASVLASRGGTFRTWRNQNGPFFVALSLLRVRPWHRFAVLEVAAGRPGTMRRSARLVRPDLAIVLNVLRTHTGEFRDLEEHAAEKRLLLDALKPGGTAVLNGDDPLVRQMDDGGRRTVRFGTTPDCDYRAKGAASAWPERLSFTVQQGPEMQQVRTQLVGIHWLDSALAVLAAAHQLGIGLAEGAALLSEGQPFPGRLQPVQAPGGAVFLRDDYNASIDTVETSLRVLENATAPRRVLVVTDMSDVEGHRKHRLKYLAERGAEAAEVLVVAGQMADYGKRRAIDAGMREENVHAFPTIQAAAEFLKTELKRDDLVLIKGRTTDHAARIFLAQLGKVGCWVEYCPKRMLCDICWELEVTPEEMRKARAVPNPGRETPPLTTA